jgi:Ca2+/Na+ antiporter
MSSSDRLLLILHIGFAIFTLGPLTAATMASPRYIRLREVSVLRYLNRATRIYGLLVLGVFVFGLALADGDFAKVWLSASMTLFVVALVLLLIVERDQRKAVHALELAAAELAPATAEPPATTAEEPSAGETAPDEKAAGDAAAGPADETGGTGPAPAPARAAVAQVEQGRIAALSGVVALIWLVILFLMVWYSR